MAEKDLTDQPGALDFTIMVGEGATISASQPMLPPAAFTETIQRRIRHPITEILGINKPAWPYSAPLFHPFPELRADILSLLERDQMIMNPGFVKHPCGTVKESLENALARASQTLAPPDVREAFARCQECIPEFATQFTEEQMGQVQRGDPAVLKQLEYAFKRLYDALITEEEIHTHHGLLHLHVREDVVRRIPDERICNRIREAVHMWDKMLRTPYRNALLTYPEQMKDPEGLRMHMNQTGQQLARMGPHYFSCNFSSISADFEGGWDRCARHLFVFAKKESGFMEIVTLLHELMHVCKDNDLLRQSYALWEKSVGGWNALSKIQKLYNIANEAEANWIEANFLNASLEASGGNIVEFCEIFSAEERSHVEVMLRCYQRYRRHQTGKYLYPIAFLRALAEYAKKMKRMPVEEISAGEFKQWA